MTSLPPPSQRSPSPDDRDGDHAGWAAPTPGTAGQIAEPARPGAAPDGPTADPGVWPDAGTDAGAGRSSGRQQVVEAYMAARRVPARWEVLRDERGRGERPATRWLGLVGLAISALALVAGGVLIARGAGGAESRIDARVAVGSSETVALSAGTNDVAVEGRGLFRSGDGGGDRRGPLLTTTIAFDPPELSISGPSGEVVLVPAGGERGGHDDRQRALVFRAEIPADGDYTVTVGEWTTLSPRLSAVVIGEAPLLRQPNVWSGIVMLAIGFAGAVITLVSMAVGTLARRRRDQRP